MAFVPSIFKFWKWNFPVCPSVCHNFLKGREVLLILNFHLFSPPKETSLPLSPSFPYIFPPAWLFFVFFSLFLQFVAITSSNLRWQTIPGLILPGRGQISKYRSAEDVLGIPDLLLFPAVPNVCLSYISVYSLLFDIHAQTNPADMAMRARTAIVTWPCKWGCEGIGEVVGYIESPASNYLVT